MPREITSEEWEYECDLAFESLFDSMLKEPVEVQDKQIDVLKRTPFGVRLDDVCRRLTN